jgi:hypothetical protein
MLDVGAIRIFFYYKHLPQQKKSIIVLYIYTTSPVRIQNYREHVQQLTQYCQLFCKKARCFDPGIVRAASDGVLTPADNAICCRP